jgi:uncharacterized membrane protein
MRMQEKPPSAFAKTETAQTQAQEHPRPHTRVLFHHEPHQHQPRNVNLLHEAEQAASGLNTRVAVALTKGVGTMWTAYTFVVLAFIGLFAILGLLNPIVALLVAWASQTFLQLVFLPIIMVGQNVLGRKTELQADEQFRTTMSTYHDIEQIMNHLLAQDAELVRLTKHLLAQDAELLRHAQLLMRLLEKNGISPTGCATRARKLNKQREEQPIAGNALIYR